MPLTPLQAILRSIPLPAAAAVASAVVTLLTPFASSYSWVAVLIGGALYVEKLITTLEQQEALSVAQTTATATAATAGMTVSSTKLTLSANPSTNTMNKAVTYIITGGDPNGTATLYQVGLPQNAMGAATGNITLNAAGTATWTATVTAVGTIGGIIAAEGSANLYAFDSADNESNVITLS